MCLMNLQLIIVHSMTICPKFLFNQFLNNKFNFLINKLKFLNKIRVLRLLRFTQPRSKKCKLKKTLKLKWILRFLWSKFFHSSVFWKIN